MNFEIVSLLIIASVNSLLSLFVLLGNRNKSSLVYSVFVIFASFWAIGLAYFLKEQDLNFALYIANYYYISAAGIPVFFLYFALTFLNKEETKLSNFRPLVVVPFILLCSLFFYDQNFLIKEVVNVSWGKDVVINKLNYLIYSLYFFVFVLLSYLKLIHSLVHTDSEDEKKQLKSIIAGTIVGFLFGMLFNLVLPFFGDYRHIYLGPIFSIVMVASIAYSITKHHLFNTKVVVTEVFMFTLWLFIFIRTIVANTIEDQIINGVLLFVTIAVGTLLIRSVLREVKQREQIENLAKELKTANEGQVSLMHFMNHQVKGRFGNAKNIFAELMTEDYGVMPKEALPLLQKGLDETNMGIDYVQNVLRGASAENGKIPYEMKPLDFKQIVETAFSKEKDRAESKGLKFNIKIDDGEYNMQGDARQLGEAVRNLIDNSISYTQEGSIDLSLSGDKYAIKLNIQDTGVGILEEDKPKLFKSGVRGTDSLRFNVNSTGYGLAFVKGVIDAHKGRVWAESEGRWKGSTFYLELPKG